MVNKEIIGIKETLEIKTSLKKLNSQEASTEN